MKGLKVKVEGSSTKSAVDNWKTVTLGDLGHIFTGRTPPTKEERYFGSEMPFICPGDMHQGRYVMATDRGLSSAGEDLLRRIVVPANSVCVGCIGWQMGEVAMTAHPSATNQQINTIVPDPQVADPHFIYYSLKPRKQELLSLGSSLGSRTPILKKSAFSKLAIRLPSLSVQRELARILSTYDDLIENNRRRIQLLEASARLLYKEWFVYLRFPRHEHVTIHDGIPDSWRKETAFDVMEIMSGGTPKTKISDYWDGDIPFFTPKDSSGEMYVYETEKFITERGLNHCNSKLYPKDTIFITARGTVGNLKMAQRNMAMNQTCYALVAKPPLNQYFLYFSLKENVEQFRSRAVGSVFDAIIRDTFKLIPFVVPNRALLDAFTENVTPIVKQIDSLISQQRKLKEARDILLPRLMNGEIAV